METYVNDAKNIWDDLHARRKDSKFNNLTLEQQLEFYQNNNKRFAMSFPIVLRYMVQLKMYHEKAFIKFIKKMRAKPYHSKLEFCERQADYVKYLYQELNPHYSTKDSQSIWKQAYDMLADEVKMFNEAEERVKEKLEKNKTLNNKEKRDELKKILDTL